jgi:hypothetical protein
MSTKGLNTLLQHLIDPDSLKVLAAANVTDDMIPLEAVRPIVHWALDYYQTSGLVAAPSLEALRSTPVDQTTFGHILDDFEVPMAEEPTDTIEWAIEDLQADWVYAEAQRFQRQFATDMAKVVGSQRVEVVASYASELVAMAMTLEDRSTHVDVREGLGARLLAYEERAALGGDIIGARLGLDRIDHHVGGIQPGELAVVAAGPKTGKSFALVWAALAEHRAGRTAVLYTLENSVAMTLDRIACLATGVDGARWQRGASSPDEVAAVRAWIEEMASSPAPLWVMQPDLGKRSFESMVIEARLRGADTVLIDQLTFVELTADGRKPRTERIGEGLHTLKGMLSTGHHRMPCLLAHQVNREGVKAANKNGWLEMHHMAESAEVERTADMVFALYQSADERAVQQVKFQMLAARRVDLRNWQLNWQLGNGNISVRQQIDLS